MNHLRIFNLALLAVALVANVHAQVETTYIVRELPKDNFLSSAAFGINDSNVVSGRIETTTFRDIAITFDGTTLTTIAPSNSMGWGINNSGFVTGHRSTGGIDHGFWWDGSLHTFPGLSSRNSRAQSIADDNTVVGNSTDSGGTRRAVIFDAAGPIILPDFGNGADADIAFSVDRIVGTSATGGATHLVLWENGVLIDLGTPGGSTINAVGFSPDGSKFVGNASISQGIIRGFVSDGTGILIAPADPWSNSTYFIGTDGSNHYGYSITSTVRRPFVYNESWGYRELNFIFDDGRNWEVRLIRDRNANGWLVGEGRVEVSPGTWEIRGWIAQPVVTVAPTSFSIFRGFLNSGGLTQLLQSDDDRMIVTAWITLFPDESPLQVVINGTAPLDDPRQLRFLVEASVSTPGLMQTVEMWNYDVGQYEVVDFWSASPTDSIAEAVVDTDAGRFIEAGTLAMKAKVSYKQVGIALHWPWSARIDHTIWRVLE